MNLNVTLVVELVIFIVFVLFTMKFVWPPLIKTLEARRVRVAEGIAAGEKGEAALATARVEIEALLQQAREQSAKIVSHAEERSNQIVTQAREDASKEAERLVAKAKSDMELELRAARDKLRLELGDIAVTVAGRILRAEIDQKKNHELIALAGKDWN